MTSLTTSFSTTTSTSTSLTTSFSTTTVSPGIITSLTTSFSTTIVSPGIITSLTTSFSTTIVSPGTITSLTTSFSTTTSTGTSFTTSFVHAKEATTTRAATTANRTLRLFIDQSPPLIENRCDKKHDNENRWCPNTDIRRTSPPARRCLSQLRPLCQDFVSAGTLPRATVRSLRTPISFFPRRTGKK